MAKDESKILIFGGTGYFGSYLVKASIKFGHQTYVYSRPDSTKTDLLHEFQSIGVIVVKGELNEHEKLVAVLKEVDVVISALAFPNILDQLNIIEAIKVAGNIKRFVPSDFGMEEDRISGLPPFEAIIDKKRRIRRSIEVSGISYTFISANCFGAYFLNYLFHPHEPHKDIFIYGCGEAKVVLNNENDIAMYTIKVAIDNRTKNRVVIYRPLSNIISQLELISMWEKKTCQNLKKVVVSDEELVTLSKTLPYPDNIRASIIYSVFVKGDTANFHIGEDEIEASELYNDLKFTTIEEFLDMFLQEPPKPTLAVF